MDKNSLDNPTKYLYRALDLLLLKHPIRTSLGCIIGYFLFQFGISLKEPYASYIPIDLKEMGVLAFISGGVIATHFRVLYGFLFGEKQVLDESLEQALALIREAKENGLPEVHQKKLYQDLIEAAARNLEAAAGEALEVVGESGGG